jgi:hypothetical protein
MIGIFALLSIPLAGYFVLGALRAPSPPAAGIYEKFPACFGLGAGILYLFFLVGNLTDRVCLLSYHLSLAALGLLWLLRRIRNRPEKENRVVSRRIGTRKLLLPGLLIAFLLSFVALTLLLPIIDWEARILWALKAKILTADPTLGGAAFRDPYRLHIHPRYPLLVPFLASWMARNQGWFLEWQYQLLINTFALLTIWQLHRMLLRLADRTSALLLTTVMAVTGVWLSAQFDSKVETALVFFSLLAVDRMFLWLEARRGIDLALAGAFLYCGAMTKNEGLLLALCACLALFTVLLKESGARGAIRSTAVLAGVFLLLFGAWFVHLVNIPPVSDEQYSARFTFEAFLQGFRRLPLILEATAARVTDVSRWHLLWLTPLFVVADLFRDKFVADRRLLLASTLAILYLAGLMTAYVISPWRDIALHVDVTFDRVALPLLPLFILMIALGATGD